MSPVSVSATRFLLRFWKHLICGPVLFILWYLVFQPRGIFASSHFIGQSGAGWLALATALLITWDRIPRVLRTFTNDPFFVLLVLLMGLSAFWSRTPMITAQAALYIMAGLLLAVAIPLAFGHREALALYCGVILAGLAVCAVDPLLSGPAAFDKYGQFKAIFADKARFSLFPALVLIAAAARVSFFRFRGAAVALGGLALFFLFLSRNNVSFIACATAVAIVILLRTKLATRKNILLAATSLAVIASVYVVSNPRGHRSFGQYISTLNGRVLIWEEIVKSLKTRPLHGFGLHGYLATKQALHARNVVFQASRYWFPYVENGYLEIGTAGGLIGVALLLASVGLAAIRLTRSPADTPEALMCVGVLVFIILTNLSGAWYLVPSVPLFFLYTLIAFNPLPSAAPSSPHVSREK